MLFRSYLGVTSSGALLTVTGRDLVAIDVDAADNCTGALGTLGGTAVDAAYPSDGFQLPLTAVGNYSDGAFNTLNATWSLEPPILNGIKISSNGVLQTGTQSGVQRVKASFGSVEGFIDVAIVDSPIAAIDVFGPSSVPNGRFAQFTADVELVGTTSACSTNTYEGTRNVEWSSSDPDRGTIVPSGIDAGLFHSLDSSGTVQLTADRGTSTGGPVVVSLTAATPVGIRCEPSTATVSNGDKGLLRMLVDYSDGSTLANPYDQGAWSASIVAGANAIQFDPADSSGVFRATETGSAEVRPTLNSTPVTQTCVITVN